MMPLILIPLALLIFIGFIVIVRLVHICAPNEVLIFSGSTRMVGTRKVGYRLVQGGRGVRIPLVEQVERMDLTNMIIDIRVTGAYAKGGIPLNVEGVANLKVASTQPTIDNAIERFLGKPRAEIIRVARETLEGNLRGVLSTLTPEEVNQDRIKFAQELLTEADKDLKNLGLELDTLKIQNVSDDRSYLDSLGRKQSADLIMRSRVAEAENKAMAAERSAMNRETQEIAGISADIATAKADAQRRILDAQTKKTAMVAEQRGAVTAAVAKAKAELEVQQARLEQVRLQLQADVVEPADADRKKMVAEAKGNAAQAVEEGKASAEALRELARTWKESGDNARQIFVSQKLQSLVSTLMGTVSSMPIEKMTIIDKALNSGGDNIAVKAAVVSEQLKHTLGIDVPALLGARSSQEKSSAKAPPRVPPKNAP